MAPSVTEYLSSLKASSKFGPQVICHRKFETREPRFAKKLPDLSYDLVETLKQSGVSDLYIHQKLAIDAILSNEDIIVATPTASGKSMIYNLPVLDDLCRQDSGHSLYLFPLKALAQDQFKIFNSFFNKLPEGITSKYMHPCAIFDGDSSPYQRKKTKENPPQVLFTNPEMLHLSILAYHSSWQHFLSKLKYVVIDEVHCYRGILGSHMAWVLKRLKRLASYYGSTPRYILLSATIGNPGSLGEELLGKPVKVIKESGGPQAEKNMVFLNPWDSAAYTASQLLEAAVKRGLRTIVYTQSRKMTELINLWTAPKLGSGEHKLSAYRAGFLPEERREIERKLFSGELVGVISTSALELGIDIGALDICILVGYPGSIMATLQRGGRVGRSQKPSATILIAGEDALDQYFMRNHEDFFLRKPEAAVLNPFNGTIMDQHLLCCAAEKVISEKELMLEDVRISERINTLTTNGSLLEIASGGAWITHRKYPQRLVSLRGGGKQMSIIDQENGEVIGEIDAARAMKECHLGAVYLHRAISWIVQSYDVNSNEIIVEKESPNYFTRPLSEKRTEILKTYSSKSSFAASVSFGTVKVREKVTGYQKRHNNTHKLISTTKLELPELIIETEALWLDVDHQSVEAVQAQQHHFMGGLHALEHGMIAILPLLVLCDRNDIGGISCPLHEQTEKSSIFIYDGYGGGVGLAQEAFEKIDQLLMDTYLAIESCTCETGCPSCVHSPKCGSGNRPIDKKSCLFLLHKILSKRVDEKPKETQNKNSMKVQKTQRASRSRDEKVLPAVALNVLPKKFVVFDLETIRSAEDVGGWRYCHKMGVSIGIVYDSESDEFISYTESEMARLVEHLQASSLVVGFNNKRFDNIVLSAYTSTDLSTLPSLDLLEEVQAYLGYRLSLNRLAEVTLGVEKSADGLQALKWYKEGRLDLIQKYCKKDVEITRDLLTFGLEQGHLLFTNKAGHKVRLPLALDRAIMKILAPSC